MLRRIVPPVIAVVVLVGLWDLYVRISGVVPRTLPAPSRVATQGWTHRSELLDHASATVTVTLIGFSISVAVAWLLAAALDFSEPARRAVIPVLVASQTIPIIALAPLMILWFGYGLLPKLVIIVLVTFFPVTLGLLEGFSAAGERAQLLMRTMGASRWQTFGYVRLPAALPRFFTALRIGITYAVVGTIFAEYAGAKEGLGIYMSLQKNAFRTDLVLAAVIVTAVLSLLLFALTHLIERVVIPWNREVRRHG